MSLRAAVVGGGIIGTAVARELTRRLPDASVTLLEKEQRLGAHQTGHNSGVVHAGLYYEPGSLKARLCRRGVRLLGDFTARHGIAFEECGKVVVALDERESGRLDALHQRSLANGVPGVRLIGAEELREVEPAAVGLRALHSPHTAIVDYPGVTAALGAELEAAGGRVLLGHQVVGLEPRGSTVVLRTRAGSSGPGQGDAGGGTDAGTGAGIGAGTDAGTDGGLDGDLDEAFDLVVTCAGLQSDRLARLAGEPAAPRIVPFLGDYVLLAEDQRDLVRGLIYPVPDPRYPFLGVHLTRHVDGEVLVGPNAFLSPGREAYRRADPASVRGVRSRGRDLRDAVGFGGFWRFAAGNLPAAAREARTAVSRRSFVAGARAYVPAVDPDRVRPGPRGIRAQAMDARGRLVDDFVISGTDRLVHVRNAPSPGATSSLAIAEHVVTGALARLGVAATDVPDPQD